MSVTVTITAPQTNPITLPFTASATVDTAGETSVLQAAWYQIDGGDAINIDFLPPPTGTTVSLSFTLDGISAGEHQVTVYGRSTVNANFSDQNFTVNGTPAPPPSFPPTAPPIP